MPRPADRRRPHLVEELSRPIPDDIASPLPAFSPAEVIAPPSPPLRREEDEWLAYQQFTPNMVRPEIRNRREVERLLERYYPPVLERTGATGMVRLRYWIDEMGEVRKTDVESSSGLGVLDRLTFRLSEILQFRPARRYGRAERVQVVVPATCHAMQ